MHTDPKPSNDQETLESIKNRFSTKLTSILYEKLTVDNIETFADDALDQAVSLTNEIMEYYYNSDYVNPDLEFKDQEDDAYEKLGLPKISNILDRIEEKKNEIDRIKDKIKKEYADTIITPPQESGVEIIPGDGKSLEKKKLLPRLLTLMYILENDLEIDLENIKITEGQVHENMMRQTPYVRVEIDDLERLIYICDEEGNASYVFDTEKLKEKRITPKELDIDDKGDKNSLIHHYPGIGMRVIQTKNWRDRIKTLLENEIPAVGEEKNPLGEVEDFEGEKVESEFKKKEKKLDYDEWIEEVKKCYQKDKDNIKNLFYWYTQESQKHKGWPTLLANAVKKYKKNIQDIYDYCGYTRTFEKKEYLPYDKWIEELKAAYEKDKDGIKAIHSWYTKESKKHNNWYANISTAAPAYNVTIDDILKAIGYGKKIENKKEYLPYDKWIEELKAAYEKDKDSIKDDIHRWYGRQTKLHEGWYSTLGQASISYNHNYTDIYNYIGYNRKIEFRENILDYTEWIKELSESFNQVRNKVKNLKKWYEEESLLHPRWYKSYEGAMRLYGITRENLYKELNYSRSRENQEEYLPYDKWIGELKAAYEKDKDNIIGFHNWYHKKSLEHKGWYSSIQHATRIYGKSKDKIFSDIGNQ